MHQSPDDPRDNTPPYGYGRARVPQIRPEPEPTAGLMRQDGRDPAAHGGLPRVSWQRSGSAARRTMFDGWGFTATGLLVAFCGWGVWAVGAARSDAVPAGLGFLALVLVAALVFAVLRLASRLVFEWILHRKRPHARWAHFFTGAYLTVAGMAYLANARWLLDGVAWLQNQWPQR